MNILLVGPWCAGKTTIGKELAERLKVPFIDIDDLTEHYGAELNWSVHDLIELNSTMGMLASESEWERIRVHAIKRTLEDYSNSVISLGASFTQYTKETYKDRVKQYIKGNHVIGLTASYSCIDSKKIHQERALESRGNKWVQDRIDFPSWTLSKLDYEISDFICETGSTGVIERLQHSAYDFLS